MRIVLGKGYLISSYSIGLYLEIDKSRDKMASISDRAEAIDVDSESANNEIRKLDLLNRISGTQQRAAEWRAARYNPAVFGEHSTIDINHGLQPGEARRQAWLANQQARSKRELDVTDLSEAQADGD